MERNPFKTGLVKCMKGLLLAPDETLDFFFLLLLYLMF